MVYEKTGIIQSGDYNILITEINKVFGVGSGNKGYGGHATGPDSSEPGLNAINVLPTNILGDVISIRDWANLRNSYADCATHQGTPLTVQQKGTIVNPVYDTTNPITINSYPISFVSGDVTVTGSANPTYTTKDGISINGTPVNFVTASASITGSVGATFTTDDGIIINGTPITFTVGSVTGTGTIINPTTLGETIVINGTPVTLALPVAEISTGFNEFLGTVGEGESATFTGITTIDDGGAPIVPTYTLLGILPTGLSLNSISGEVAGIATDGSVAVDTIYNFLVEADDGGASTIQQNFIIHVNCATFEDGVGLSATGRQQKPASVLANDINNVYGVGTGTSGYGQSPVTLPTVGQEVLKSDLLAWRTAINACAEHQGTILNPSSPSITLLNDPKPWDAIGFFNGLRSNLSTGITNITANKILVDPASISITANPNAVNSMRALAWSTSVQHQFTASFVDHDHARAFFNAGGQIRLAASRVGGSATTQNTDWTNLLNTAGTVIFDTANYFTLTTTLTSIANFIGTGAYAANDWDISASSNTIIDGTGRGGKGFILTFRSLFNDDHIASGLGPDSVDGTLTSSISMRNVDGTPLTITAPTFTTTVVL